MRLGFRVYSPSGCQGWGLRVLVLGVGCLGFRVQGLELGGL